MKERRQPERTCAACRSKAPKQNLIRIVKNKNNEIFIDENHKIDGRGMYICLNEDCVNRAIKTKAINRSFKTNIEDSVYGELVKYYERSKN